MVEAAPQPSTLWVPVGAGQELVDDELDEVVEVAAVVVVTELDCDVVSCEEVLWGD